MDKESVNKFLDKVLDDVADAIFTRAQENIVKIGAVDTGLLLTTANVNRSFLEKELVWPAPHAAWIEFGTPPHSVSAEGRQKIAQWAHRKLQLNEKEAESASWAIAKKIREHGQPARPFLRPAVDEVLLRGAI